MFMYKVYLLTMFCIMPLMYINKGTYVYVLCHMYNGNYAEAKYYSCNRF